MKNIFSFSLIAILTFAVPLLAFSASSFEGEVDYQYTTGDNNFTMAEFIKDKKMRIDTKMKGQQSSAILDLTIHKIFVLMPQQKTYTEMQIPTPGKNQKTDGGTFSRTGKTLEILGYPCEEWLYKTTSAHTSIWVASGFGTFQGLDEAANTGNSEWMQAVKSKGLFPLKVIENDISGKTIVTLVATKIDKNPPPSDLFQVPSGYKKMEIKTSALEKPTPLGKK